MEENMAEIMKEQAQEASVLDALTAEQQNQLPGICKVLYGIPLFLEN